MVVPEFGPLVILALGVAVTAVILVRRSVLFQ